MIHLITSDCYGEFAEELAQMHKLRYRVFKERLDWDLETVGTMEVDAFDALRPSYLLQRDYNGTVRGCVRFLPTLGPTMLRDVFPVLLNGEQAPAFGNIWESSRFAVDLPTNVPKVAGRLATPTYELFAGMVEFGLAHGLAKILTVTDVRMERILRRAVWPLDRLGPPRSIGTTMAVAGYLEVSQMALTRLREAGGFGGPVLWAPVIRAAA